jgi:pimeloyl-ACP methyl ester carboxylesterase
VLDRANPAAVSIADARRNKARFGPLLGRKKLSQGAAISIGYSVRHPERVTHLVLCGGFALGGKKRSPGENEKRAAMATLMRLGWGLDDPGFRQLVTSRMMPDATKEQADAFNELKRRATSPECAVRYFETIDGFDINDLLGQVRVPTLVMRVRSDESVRGRAPDGVRHPVSLRFRATIT